MGMRKTEAATESNVVNIAGHEIDLNASTEVNDNPVSAEDKQMSENKGLDQLDENAAAILKSLGIDPKKEEIKTDAEETEDSSTDQENTETEKTETEDTSKETKEINEDDFFNNEIFKLDRHGETYQVKNKDEAKELMQKGLDYTKKTQSLADDKKKFEVEYHEVEKQLETKVKELENKYSGMDDKLEMLEKWDFFFNSIKDSSPDLFEQIQSQFNESTKHYDNPLIKSQLVKMQKEIESLKGQGVERENEGIRKQFDKEFDELMSTIGIHVKPLGLTIDKEKIKEAWIKSAKDAKQAFYMIYGESLHKLTNSKSKIQGVKNTIASKRPTPVLAKKGINSQKPGMNFSKLSQNQIIEKVLAGDLPY